MAPRIIWSQKAQADRKAIFKYWNKRNKSNNYSKKLNTLFKVAIKLISEYPEIGKPTDVKDVRIKIVRDYLIIYEINGNEQIIILTLWDSRQNPKSLRIE